MLARLCSKSSKLGCSSMWTENFQMYKLGLENAVESEIKLPTFVSNMISGSSTFSKPSLYIWKFSVYILLNPSLKDFEHDLASMWKEHDCTVVWRFFGIVFPWDWNFSNAMSTENGGKYWIVVKMVGRFIILTWNNIWNTLHFKYVSEE